MHRITDPHDSEAAPEAGYPIAQAGPLDAEVRALNSRHHVVVITDMPPAIAAGFEVLDAVGFDVEMRGDLYRVADESRLLEGLSDAWAVVAGAEPYAGSLFERLPGLRVVARPGAGFDTVDVASATARGILVFTTPAPLGEAVADFTVGLMLAAFRRIVTLDRSLRDGVWHPEVMGSDLHGATIGIVGLGRIGRAVATRLGGFGCRLIATEPEPDAQFCAQHGIEVMELEPLLEQADLVTLHVPLVAGTRRLIDGRRLDRMKPGAVLVNTSRGGIVDEAALVASLRRGHLRAAGLDVFAVEPLPPDHPLLGLDNVVLTGHVASHTPGTLKGLVDATVAGLVAAAAGRSPENALNPEVLSLPYWTATPTGNVLTDPIDVSA
jgi:phosphoglycerate dehydrogenase-like enzyme